MKQVMIILFYLLAMVFLDSCIMMECYTPEQKLLIAYDKSIPDITIESKWGHIDEKQILSDKQTFELKLPDFRWGKGKFLGWVYRDDNPENIEFIYINKYTEKLDSFSINEIKTMQSIMVDSMKVYLLPEERLKQKL